MAFSTIVGLIVVVISLAYFWLRKKYLFFEENGFLHEKPVWFFGNVKGVGSEKNIAYIIKDLYKKFKGKAPAFGIYFFTTPNVVITDLETIKNVLVRDFDTFHNRGLYYNEKDDPLSGHIFAIEDAAWRNMRLKLTPTFTSGKMKIMFDTVLGISDLMVEQLEKQPSLELIELKNILANFTTDVIGNIAFGLEMNSISDPDAMFRKMGKRIFKSDDRNFQLRVFFLTTFRTLGRKLGMSIIPKEVSEFFLRTLRETVDYRLKNKIQRNDMMDMLLRLIDDGTGGEGKLTFNEIAAQCFVFFNAGFETSSSTSCFALYALSLNKGIQEKLRDEIKTVLAKHGMKLSYEAMQEMKYLQMTIDETLRMYPPVAQLLRQTSKTYKIPNSKLTVPEGSLAFIPVYAIHTDPEIFPEPEKFDPERFSEENKKNRHPMAYLPFGDGPRNCIGLRFGLMQTKIALIKLLINFKFSPTLRTTIPMRFDAESVILAPVDGMWLKAEKL